MRATHVYLDPPTTCTVTSLLLTFSGPQDNWRTSSLQYPFTMAIIRPTFKKNPANNPLILWVKDMIHALYLGTIHVEWGRNTFNWICFYLILHHIYTVPIIFLIWCNMKLWPLTLQVTNSSPSLTNGFPHWKKADTTNKTWTKAGAQKHVFKFNFFDHNSKELKVLRGAKKNRSCSSLTSLYTCIWKLK